MSSPRKLATEKALVEMSDEFKIASISVCVPERAKAGIDALRQTIAEMPGVQAVEEDGYGFFVEVATKDLRSAIEKLHAIEDLKTPTGYVIILQFISGEPWHRLQSHEVH